MAATVADGDFCSRLYSGNTLQGERQNLESGVFFASWLL